MSYALHPEAEAELMEAAAYLALHASKKIANAYLDDFDRVATLVDLYPELGTTVEGGYRIYPFTKFKYSLVYVGEPTGALIVAVAPQLREPGYWKSRAQHASEPPDPEDV